MISTILLYVLFTQSLRSVLKKYINLIANKNNSVNFTVLLHKMECNKENIIKIQSVNEYSRIGEVFNELFSVILETEKDENATIKWDFENVTFIHPLFLAPLSIYKASKQNITLINTSKIRGYLDTVRFEETSKIVSEQDIKTKLCTYLSKSYIPICCFDVNNKHIDGIQSVLQRVIERQCGIGSESAIITPLSYMFGELITNIKEHSDCKHGYIFSQYLQRERCLNICISDDGITVLGSYRKAGKFLNEIQDNPAQALKYANEGNSTKNNSQERGFGIRTTRQMLVEGLNGSFFMMSGNAFFRSTKGKQDEVKELPKRIYWKGTIILIKIPIDVPQNFEYSKYLE